MSVKEGFTDCGHLADARCISQTMRMCVSRWKHAIGGRENFALKADILRECITLNHLSVTSQPSAVVCIFISN